MFLNKQTLVHTRFQSLLDNLVRHYDIHHRAPAAVGVAVHGGQQTLRNHLEQLVGLHVVLVATCHSFPFTLQSLARTEQTLSTGRGDSVLGRVHARTDCVHGIDERLSVLLLRPGCVAHFIESSNDRLHKEGAETMLVQLRTNQRSEGFRADVAILAKFIRIHLVLQLLRKGLCVALQTVETDKDLVVHLIYLREIAVDCLELRAQTEITKLRAGAQSLPGDGNAVLSLHCQHRGAVVRHDIRHFRFLPKDWIRRMTQRKDGTKDSASFPSSKICTYSFQILEECRLEEDITKTPPFSASQFGLHSQKANAGYCVPQRLFSGCAQGNSEERLPSHGMTLSSL